MSDDINDELAKILARDTELRAENTARKQDQEDRARIAAVLWRTRIEDEIIPGIEPLTATLTDAGWICQIEKPQDALKLSIYKGDMQVWSSRQRPFIAFELVKGHDTLGVTEGTTSGVGPGGPIGQNFNVNIPVEVVKKLILEFVRKLALK